MRRASLIIWVATAAAGIAAVTLAMLLLIPEVANLRGAAARAADSKASLERLEAHSVGADFERDLRLFAGLRAEKAAEVDVVRARLAGRLDAPFRDMKIGAGASRPSSDEFQRAYNFHGDQLKGRVRDLASRAGGPEIREIPLIQPGFRPGLEVDAAAMRRMQRQANVEARLLEAAAKLGGVPATAVRIDEEPAPPDDADAGYERLRIGVDLLCPDGRASAIVHEVLGTFDELGGVARLTGMIETPVPEARLKQAPASPAKRLTVTLSLGHPTPAGEAP